MESLTFLFQPSKIDIICSFAFKLLNLDNIKNIIQSVKRIFAKNKCGHFGRRLYFIFCPYSHMALSLYHFANVILLIHNNGKYQRGPLPQGISRMLNFPGQVSFAVWISCLVFCAINIANTKCMMLCRLLLIHRQRVHHILFNFYW